MTDFLKLIGDDGWRHALARGFEQDYMRSLEKFLTGERKRGAKIFPAEEEIFAAFNLTPISQTKVVILGQDPYHGPGQAMGLAFSVRSGAPPPPSLRNMFKELASDLGGPLRTNGDLSDWARQGVLLLNTVLTVERGKAASHAGKGWEQFTSSAISALNAQRTGVAYLLWGAHAQKYAELIDLERNFVLTAPHPSPLSAYRGFFGSKPFSSTNSLLRATGVTEISWSD